MIDRDQIVGEDELNAYVDGELPAERLGAVEAW
ncbi:MAG: anti-sigma factor, partial [Xanthobacteraceae bacterium]